MTEPKPVYQVRTIAELTEEEIILMNFALSILGPETFASIAAKVKAVCEEPGIGKVYITIEKGHPHLVGMEIAEKIQKDKPEKPDV
jgi:hypothetical protein